MIGTPEDAIKFWYECGFYHNANEARAELAALRAENARLSAAVEQARYILMAIDNSGSDSQLCDISVRQPEDIHGVWICDAATAWLDANPAPEQPNQ